MRRELEELLLRFESEFKNNPDLRIEDFLVDPTLLDRYPKPETDEFLRHLILLESELRFMAGQPLEKNEYESRFPGRIEYIDEAFNALDDRRLKETDSFDLLKVTLLLGGSYNVNPNEKLGLPDELGKYKEIRKVGEGSFGVVCKALDTETGELRALKFPKSLFARGSGYLEEVKRETDRSKGLDHPNIIKTFGMEIIEPYPFVVQEFVDGSSLKEWLEHEHSIREKAQMISQIACGLQYAHEKQITHCDIKPANILVDSAGTPKIGDFGVSFHEKDRYGLPVGRIGTALYLAPEIVEKYLRHSDGRADIFSLGVVFYEMMAGQRPFGFDGAETDEIFFEILNNNPRSIRLLNRTNGREEVDRELERICFRCLQKKTLDRYQMAADLQEELDEWLQTDKESQGNKNPSTNDLDEEIQFVPRGLRAYTAEDADFFLELLPGVRDKGHVPTSLSFWTKRIVNPERDEDRVPNGFLFGPSGSGKSSFVKAGLIPLVENKVETIYVESTTDDTEVRILKTLRSKFPQIPNYLSLPDVFAGLANGNWREENHHQKILLVLDQFEQWISRDEKDQSQLVKALKHCDGTNIQCLMLLRDDFYTASMRFADALDVNIKEAVNSKDIDLFDQKHAKKILIKLGQAYGQIPTDELTITPDQHDFLNHTIEQLSQNKRVICVRLTLFAEMFKDREWTSQELKLVGGVAGVGEQFLESNFGEQTEKARFRRNREQIKSILEELLPDTGRDIRGAMKSRADLIRAAGCETDERTFNDVIGILHDDLKLITRTNPDAIADEINALENEVQAQTYYQLTHDYLVPSIREWLNTSLKNTRRGRALIRLRELAAQVVPGQKPKYLPGSFEWLYWQFSIRNQIKSDNEKLINRTAKWQFGRSTSAIMVVIVILLGISLSIINRNNQIKSSIAFLLNVDVENLPTAIEELQIHRKPILRRLERMVDDRTLGSDDRFRARVAIWTLGGEFDDDLIDVLLRPTTDPSVIQAFCDSVLPLNDLKQPFVNKLVSATSYPNEKFFELVDQSKLRFYSLIAQLEPNRGDWKNSDQFVANSITKEPEFTHLNWIALFKPVGKQLVDGFAREFENSINRVSLGTLAIAIYEFVSQEKSIDLFSTLLLDSSDLQFDAILACIEEYEEANHFRPSLLKLYSLESTDANGRATIGIALLRLGQNEKYLESLSESSSGQEQAFSIFEANNVRVPFRILRELWNNPQVTTNENTKFHLLLSYADRAISFEKVQDEKHRKWLLELAKESMVSELNSGCYALWESIIQRTDEDYKTSLKSLRSQRAEIDNGRLGEIFIDKSLIPFSIIKVSNDGNEREVAISLREISEDKYAAILGLNMDSKGKQDLPKIVYSAQEFMEFANQAGDENYFESQDFEDPLNSKSLAPKQGYRFFFEDEWVTVQAQQPKNLLGNEGEYAHKFICSREWSATKLTQPGLLLPSRIGLYDIWGNALELCIRDTSAKTFMGLGGSTQVNYNVCEFPVRLTPPDKFHPNHWCGVRLVTEIITAPAEN